MASGSAVSTVMARGKSCVVAPAPVFVCAPSAVVPAKAGTQYSPDHVVGNSSIRTRMPLDTGSRSSLPLGRDDYGELIAFAAEVSPMPSDRSKRRLKVQVKAGKTRSLSSKLWLDRQLNDPYVARAKREG